MIKPEGVDPGSAAFKTFDFENRFHFITDFAFVNMKMKMIFIFYNHCQSALAAMKRDNAKG